jgi:hypothetical protein
VLPYKPLCCFAEDLDITVHADVSMRVVDDIKFFRLEEVRVDFTIGRLRLRLNKLFNGLKALGRDQHQPESSWPWSNRLKVLTAVNIMSADSWDVNCIVWYAVTNILEEPAAPTCKKALYSPEMLVTIYHIT